MEVVRRGHVDDIDLWIVYKGIVTCMPVLNSVLVGKCVCFFLRSRAHSSQLRIRQNKDALGQPVCNRSSPKNSPSNNLKFIHYTLYPALYFGRIMSATSGAFFALR